MVYFVAILYDDWPKACPWCPNRAQESLVEVPSRQMQVMDSSSVSVKEAAPAAAEARGHARREAEEETIAVSTVMVANDASVGMQLQQEVTTAMVNLTIAPMKPSDCEVTSIMPDERTGEFELDDLGTPVATGDGAFGEASAEFSCHRFIGPSGAGDDGSVRQLHGLRRVNLLVKPPRFESDVASGTAARRGSAIESTEVGSTRSLSSSGDETLNSFSVTLSEPHLGFQTSIAMPTVNELAVQVTSVERDSPAFRAGVVVGDTLLSVNGQAMEAHLTDDQVLEIIETASTPRTIVFVRSVQDTASEPRFQSKSLNFLEKKASIPLFGRLSSAMSYGSSLVGSALKRRKTIVHEDVFCDGCGMDPIQGALWTCSVCSNYNLCHDCYAFGTHGMENTDEMQALSEAIVQEKLQKKCKRFTPEFMLSLRRDICKGRTDKLEYMGGWIADIVIGTAASKIQVRGIEIPSLTPIARQRFVSQLMPLVSNRTDIEVNIEWLPDDTERDSVEMDDANDKQADEAVSEAQEPSDQKLEKLRIWISDKKTRTTSPFT